MINNAESYSGLIRSSTERRRSAQVAKFENITYKLIITERSTSAYCFRFDERLWSSRVSRAFCIVHHDYRETTTTKPFMATAMSSAKENSKKRKLAELEDSSKDGQLIVKVSDDTSAPVGPVLGKQASPR